MQLHMNTQLDAKSQDLIQLPATSAANGTVTYSVKFAERRSPHQLLFIPRGAFPN